MHLLERSLHNLKLLNWKHAALLFFGGMTIIWLGSRESIAFTEAMRFLISFEFYSLKQFTFSEMPVPGYVILQARWDIPGIILNITKVALWLLVIGRILYILFRKPINKSRTS